MDKRVLFLDIDGVLNSETYHRAMTANNNRERCEPANNLHNKPFIIPDLTDKNLIIYTIFWGIIFIILRVYNYI